MKIILKIFLSLILVSSTACAQNTSSEIVMGKWRYVGTIDQKVAIECPDMLVLNDNEDYVILNDCYGNDIVSPIVETGKWSFDKSTSRVSLVDRKLATDYSFKNKAENLVGIVNVVSKKEITICFGEKSDCTEEKYIRINQ